MLQHAEEGFRYRLVQFDIIDHGIRVNICRLSDAPLGGAIAVT